MENFNIFKIKINNFYLNDNIKANDISKEKLKKNLLKFVEPISVSLDTMMESIVDIINLEKYEIGDTSLSFENEKVIYQICHMRRKYKESDQTSKETFNCIATSLSTSKETIYSTAVLLCSSINDDGTCTPKDINFDDFVNLYYSKIVHKALLIEPNDNVTEILFKKSPFEDIDEDHLNYRYSDQTFFGLRLHINGQLEPKPNILNKKMTKIYGNRKVYGKIILIIKSHDYNVCDIDKKLLDKLLCISEGPLSSRNLESHEMINRKETDNNMSRVMNGFNVIQKRYIKYINSNIKNTHKFVCQGCFRLRYKSRKDQKNDWKKHSKECLYKKNESFNDNLVKEELVIRHKEKISENIKKEEEEDEKACKEFVTY
jgi:hypothetical protein